MNKTYSAKASRGKQDYNSGEIESKWPFDSAQGKQTYNPTAIESKWQAIWEKEKIFSPDLTNAQNPYYTLMMFPYPSAEGLHVGNMYAFTGADIQGRYMRMKGKDVFEPIGLDGFGIHSENYAIKVGRHPREQAKISQENFYRQLRATGNAYDWTRTLETYDADYYKWTQWIFVQMFKKGLAYRKKAQVNWCPSDLTVLADEQVIDGKCERDGSTVEKRDLEQWFFKITEYADELLNGLNQIDWPEKIKIAQKQWIGKKIGINIKYKVDDLEDTIEVFTTRPDTNFGATFIALAPEHPLALKLATAESKKDVERYINVSKKKTDQERKEDGKEKTGIFTGAYAINDLTGYKMPIWVSDFVLMEFGTGAVVGVPGHDKRDFEFAKKFGLKIIRVVVGTDRDSSDITKIEQVQEEEGRMVNSDFLNGMDIHEATIKIMDYMEEKGHGKRKVTYHLRDWLISRQRYWGPPIPMVYCSTCEKNGRGERKDMPGWWTVSEDQLPVELPDVKDWRPQGTGTSPLANHPEFYETTCPSCNSSAKRETDVSDTFLDSSWYYLRYLSIGSGGKQKNISKDIKSHQSLEIGSIGNWKFDEPYEINMVRKWCPVAIYIGGSEHSVLHLLYVRFVAMVLHDLNSPLALPFQEPFPRFYAHGLLISEGAKMSKSRGNIIVPDDYIKKFGADTLRLYLMFLGPFDHGGDFRDTGIEGMNRFVRRVWTLLTKTTDNLQLTTDRLRFMHKTIKAVSEDIESFSYNTAIARLMEWYNFISNSKYQISKMEAEVFLKLLAPFAPHLTEELWGRVSRVSKVSEVSKGIHFEEWPEYDEKYLVEDQVTVVVQVNGKRRGEVTVDSSNIDKKQEVEALARKEIEKYVKGKLVKNIIYVPGRIINFVI
ncbi:MAG: leucine--tRNA ligase [Candidatus Levybacteria bacterium]|nr:leucine--tRNA ligase [Candidatus Levybacteria bacterium]